MCDECNGMSKRQIKERTKLDIARYGWQAVAVEGGFDQPAISYSVGLTEIRHPELLVVGRRQEEAYCMLGDLVAMVLGHRHVLEPGIDLDLSHRRVHLAPIESPNGILLMGHSIYGKRLRALQVVWADDSDNLPWEQDIPDSLTQPIFGTPPEQALRTWRHYATGE